jgi:hypothetical protein
MSYGHYLGEEAFRHLWLLQLKGTCLSLTEFLVP